jgi:TetR/AcrR family transcriptional regulator, mexJK operon transcriptional repressor
VEHRAARSEAARRERRDAILQAAIQLFAQRGFAAAGMSEIARAAGVSHGTVFLYFASKDALFRAAILEPLEEFAARSVEIMDGEGGALARVRRLVGEQVRDIAAERSYLQAVGAARAQAEQFGDLAREISVIIERVVARLAALVTEGMETGELADGVPDVVAASYIAYLNGIGLVVGNADDDPVWELLVDQGLRLFAPTKGDAPDD